MRIEVRIAPDHGLPALEHRGRFRQLVGGKATSRRFGVNKFGEWRAHHEETKPPETKAEIDIVVGDR